MSDQCPTGCGRTRKHGHLMCPTCWRRVPGDLQHQVYRAWQAWRRDMGNVDLMREHGHVSDLAIKAATR